MKLLWGSLLLVLGLTIAVIGLIDLGVFLLMGSTSTLSQSIAETVGHTAGAFLATNGFSFVAGMLATHFTDFRIRQRKTHQFSSS